jgi:hypothetical protein
MSGKDNAFFAGYAVAGLAAFIGLLFQSSRPEVIPAFKASKEVKQKLNKVAKSRGWSQSQTAYVATSIGVEMLLEEDRKAGVETPEAKK